MKIVKSLKSFFRSGNYKIKREIEGILKIENPIIIEAGAHIGTDTVEMSKLWPKGTIHAFEPVPSIYKKLVNNCSSSKNVITHPLALSNSNGYAEIFVSSGESDGSSSLLSPKEHLAQHPDVQFNSKITIETITLDEWAKKNKVEHVDFAWLDMQGLEFPVLSSSEIIFKTLTAVYTEVSLKEMYHGAILYPEFKQWMKSNGFEVKLEDMPYPDFGNVLFVKSE